METAISFHPLGAEVLIIKDMGNNYDEDNARRAAAVGEFFDEPYRVFGVRSPVGAYFASGYATLESGVRTVGDIGEAAYEGAKDVYEGLDAFSSGVASARGIFWK